MIKMFLFEVLDSENHYSILDFCSDNEVVIICYVYD